MSFVRIIKHPAYGCPSCFVAHVSSRQKICQKVFVRKAAFFNRHVFLGTPQVLLVETGDILTLVVGLVIVIVIAFIANPHYLSELTPPAPTPAPVPPVTDTPVPATITPVVTIIPSRNPTPTPQPTVAPPYRIVYTSNPFLYPKFKMPANMDIFGAGDVPLRNREMVPFAYISESRGGLTHKFLVPYPIWVINTTVIANLTPQYGNFKMVLCYASNGTVINGEEIFNRGSLYRVIERSNTDMYMIITTDYIDSYTMTLETPRNYYNQYNKPPA
jgi:hypothetical protein